MKNKTLQTLYVNELRDLYDAENRLLKAIPKMAKAANSEKLRKGFEEHLEQTKGHVDRLEQVLSSIGEKVSAKKCPGMAGIVQEGEEMMKEGFEGAVADAALISAAQRVEHYEIAAYGCVHAWAVLLEEDNAAELLEQTLDEEKETDEKLTELAEEINSQAKSSAMDDKSSEERTVSRANGESTKMSKPRSRAARA